jgi:hypothetical protein
MDTPVPASAYSPASFNEGFAHPAMVTSRSPDVGLNLSFVQ